MLWISATPDLGYNILVFILAGGLQHSANHSKGTLLIQGEPTHLSEGSGALPSLAGIISLKWVRILMKLRYSLWLDLLMNENRILELEDGLSSRIVLCSSDFSDAIFEWRSNSGAVEFH